jgi:hypothetical protein
MGEGLRVAVVDPVRGSPSESIDEVIVFDCRTGLPSSRP